MSRLLGVDCHSLPYVSAPPLLAPLTLELTRLKMRMIEVEAKTRMCPVCGPTCARLRSDLSSDIFSSCWAKRPTGDSSSTRCGVPPGMDWTLQAEVLSIPPLQATQETGHGATVLLCLSAHYWASALGWAAGFTGAFFTLIVTCCTRFFFQNPSFLSATQSNSQISFLEFSHECSDNFFVFLNSRFFVHPPVNLHSFVSLLALLFYLLFSLNYNPHQSPMTLNKT